MSRRRSRYLVRPHTLDVLQTVLQWVMPCQRLEVMGVTAGFSDGKKNSEQKKILSQFCFWILICYMNFPTRYTHILHIVTILGYKNTYAQSPPHPRGVGTVHIYYVICTSTHGVPRSPHTTLYVQQHLVWRSHSTEVTLPPLGHPWR